MKPPLPLRDREIQKKIEESLRRTGVSAQDSLHLSLEAVVHLIKTANLLTERINQHLAPFRLTSAKFNLLILLWVTDEPALPMTELSERMSVTGANVTKLADGLEAEGWLKRERKPGDRRVVLAVLTEKGRALLEQVLPGYYQHVREVGLLLDDSEKLNLIHLTMKLRNALASAASLPPDASSEPPPK